MATAVALPSKGRCNLRACTANNAHQPISLCKIRNFPTSLANNSVFKKSRQYQNFGPFGHNLHSHLFDDVILKTTSLHMNIFYTYPYVHLIIHCGRSSTFPDLLYQVFIKNVAMIMFQETVKYK